MNETKQEEASFPLFSLAIDWLFRVPTLEELEKIKSCPWVSAAYIKGITLEVEGKENEALMAYASEEKGDTLARIGFFYLNEKAGLGLREKKGGEAWKKEEESRWKDILECWEESARRGDRRGEISLAFCYYEGGGVAKDFKKAFDLFTKHANTCSIVDYCLGECYEEGKGTRKDYDQAIKFYSQVVAGARESVPRRIKEEAAQALKRLEERGKEEVSQSTSSLVGSTFPLALPKLNKPFFWSTSPSAPFKLDEPSLTSDASSVPP